MAVAVTYDAGLNTNKRLLSWLSRGKKMATGTLNFSGLTYINGGVTVTLAGLSTVDACWIHNHNGLEFEFIFSSAQLIKIRVAGNATNTATIAAGENVSQEIASGTALSSYTAVKFWAVGS